MHNGQSELMKSFDCNFGSLRGTPVFLNLDLISGMKYVYLLTEISVAKVGVLWKLFRKLAIGVYPYNGVTGAGTMQPLNKALSVFISPIL